MRPTRTVLLPEVYTFAVDALKEHWTLVMPGIQVYVSVHHAVINCIAWCLCKGGNRDVGKDRGLLIEE